MVNLSSDYSQDVEMKSLNLSASGAIVGHSGGILLSNTLNDSFAIIKADGVSDANVSGADTKTNKSGYAIYPNLVPYRKNLVGIDTQNLDYNINIEEPRKMVIPRSGSAVLVNLATKIGAPIVNKPNSAEKLIQATFSQRQQVAERTADIPQKERIKAYMANPDLTTYGSGKYTGVMMEHAGAYNVAAETVKGYKQDSLEQIISWNPEVIFIQK